MGHLDAAILKTAPREKAGARTGARFAFQAHVSLMKVLNLHERDADYRAIFDRIDDLTILDASEHPASVDFFQINGQEASWTATKLCTAKGVKPRTAIGKIDDRLAFGAALEQDFPSPRNPHEAAFIRFERSMVPLRGV